MGNSAIKLEAEIFNSDALQTDYQLFRAEIEVNYAHCEALFHAGVLTRIEAERIRNALQSIFKRAEYDKNYFNNFSTNDIYSFVSARLVQLVGEVGKKIRVGRSEAEHRLTTLRLWLRGEIEGISTLVKEFQNALVTAGENQKSVIFPVNSGFDKKHIVLWAHWCLAHFEMLERDRERLDEVWRRVNVSPFGTETSFEIDREEIAAVLKFEGVSMNGLDAVTDTDFLVEFCSACSILSLHLARFGEEIVIYISKEFELLEFKDKNQLVKEINLNYLELLRSKASRIFGYQIALLSSGNKFFSVQGNNLSEEKQILFETVKTVKFCLQVATLVIKNIIAHETKVLNLVTENQATGIELIDYLLKKDVSLEAAKETVDKILKHAAAKNKRISELAISELQSFSTFIEKDVFQALTIEETLANKNQIGGTAPERVFEALDAARKSLEREEIQAKN